MEKLKVNYTGFYSGFNPEQNFISDKLRLKYQVVLSEQPDFLFFDCFSSEHLKFNNCVKIFWTGEVITPDFNECDYAIGYDYIQYEDRYCRLYRGVRYSEEEKKSLSLDMVNRRFCNFVYHNIATGSGVKIREAFCKKLTGYKHIDCPGRSLNNMTDNVLGPRTGNWRKGKLDFLKNYKFTIAFENASCIGYVTEKLMQPLQSHSIPIYWGDPEVAREFNPKSFINCHDFKNFDEVIEYIEYLDNNDEAYMTMLRQPPMQSDFVYDYDKVDNFIFNILKKGNRPYPKNPRNLWDSKANTIIDLLRKHNELLRITKPENYIEKMSENAYLALNIKKESLVWATNFFTENSEIISNEYMSKYNVWYKKNINIDMPENVSNMNSWFSDV